MSRFFLIWPSVKYRKNAKIFPSLNQYCVVPFYGRKKTKIEIELGQICLMNNWLKIENKCTEWLIKNDQSAIFVKKIVLRAHFWLSLKNYNSKIFYELLIRPHASRALYPDWIFKFQLPEMCENGKIINFFYFWQNYKLFQFH